MSDKHSVYLLNIFVLAATDTRAENEATRRVVEKLNRITSVRRLFLLRVIPHSINKKDTLLKKEEFARYTSQLQTSFATVVILGKKVGAGFTHPGTGKTYRSKQEFQILTALKSRRKGGYPHILLYRENLTQKVAEYHSSMEIFVERLLDENLTISKRYYRFNNTREFEAHLLKQLRQDLINLMNKWDHRNLPFKQTKPLPELQVEARRLDIAIQTSTVLHELTEIWIQITTPEKEGFRYLLPDVTDTSYHLDDPIHRTDLPVAYPLSSRQQKVQPVRILVEVTSSDFVIKTTQFESLLYPVKSSGRIVFDLLPERIKKDAVVSVKVSMITASNQQILLGTASIRTYIQATSVSSDDMPWHIESIMLGHPAESAAQENFSKSRRQDYQKDDGSDAISHESPTNEPRHLAILTHKHSKHNSECNQRLETASILTPPARLTHLHTHKIYDLTLPDSYIGRHSKQDIIIQDATISREQIVLLHRSAIFIVRQISPHVPTFINQVRVIGEAEIRNGDIITFGQTELRFEILDDGSG